MPSGAERARAALQGRLPAHEHVVSRELKGDEGALHIRLRFAARRLPHLGIDDWGHEFARRVPTCGWWWCLHDDPTVPRWDDLDKAAKYLVKRGFDPAGWPAAKLMNGYLVRELWLEEQGDLEKLHNLLLGFTPKSNVLGNIRGRFLAEIQHRMRVTESVRKKKRPGPGRTPDNVARETLIECEQDGLVRADGEVDARAVAALVCLFGGVNLPLKEIEKRFQHQKLTLVD